MSSVQDPMSQQSAHTTSDLTSYLINNQVMDASAPGYVRGGILQASNQVVVDTSLPYAVALLVHIDSFIVLTH